MELNKKNFNELCKYMNHQTTEINKQISLITNNMSKMELNMNTIRMDVSWMKKILWAIFGVTILSMFGILIKSLVGF